MEKKYRDLYALFQNEPMAWQYYYSLPPQIRERVSEGASNLHTYSGLKHCADAFLRGNA